MMKCGASQKLFAPICQLSSRSLKAASANGWPSVSTNLYFFNSSSSLSESISAQGCSSQNGSSGIVSTLFAAFKTQLSPQVLTTRLSEGDLLSNVNGISRMIALTFFPAWQSM